MSHFFIGGVLLSYFVSEFWKWLNLKFFWESNMFLRILGILSGNALVGVFWEIFEYWYSQGTASFGDNGWFYRDTIWDLQMNFLGALIFVLFRHVL